MKHVVLLKSRVPQKGGLEKAASRIANAFAARGSKVSLLTTTGKERAYPSNVSIVPFQTIRWPAFLRMEQFDQSAQEWIKNEKPDLVFGMDRNRFQTHFRAGNGVHIAYLKSRVFTEGRWKYLSCLINPMHRKILEMEKTALQHPELKKIIANSDMVKRDILKYYEVDEKKIVVLHNGVEWNEMSEAFSQKKQGPVFHFLFIGNGYLRKGLKVLLDAFSQMRKWEFLLSVIGKDNNMAWFQKYTVKLGLQNKVRFLGYLENITPFYQSANALVIPSFYDPFANVTVEALAMGLCVISSKYNGGHEILTKENGIIIEDLLHIDSLTASLETALTRHFSASQIRKSVEYLDFSKQLDTLIKICE